MSKIRLRNIGPIKKGLQNTSDYIEFKGVTVFIGDQGTGKSTIAKLFSTLSWIEKALVRGDFSTQYVMQYNRFKNKFLAYQNISNYLNDNSYFEYIGNAFDFEYSKGQFKATSKQSNKYSFPKIMYVPAERNFVSSVEKPDLIKRLPLPLYTFMDEYEDAKLNTKGNFALPIGNAKFEYRRQTKKSYIIGNDYNIELTEASSGYQSLVPLIMVTKHLSDIIQNKTNDHRKEINRDEEERIRKAVSELIKDNKITDEVLKAALEELSFRFKYSSFINIVEEPEQNLFPTSQKKILFELLKYYNENDNNNFVITTHSPYIINYLSLAIQSSYLKEKIDQLEKGEKKKELLERLNRDVPLESSVETNKVNIYQIDDKGVINRLEMPYGIPSDKNYLNQQLRFGNVVFDSLLEIEEEI